MKYRILLSVLLVVVLLGLYGLFHKQSSDDGATPDPISQSTDSSSGTSQYSGLGK